MKTICGVTYVMVSVFTLPATLHSADDASKKVGYLGVTVDEAASGTLKGPYVEVVKPDSPAEQAGIRKYDVIFAVGDSATPDIITFIDTIYSLAPGQMVRLQIWRKGKDMPITVTLGERPLFNMTLRQKDPPRVIGGTGELKGNSIGGITTGGNVIVRERPTPVKGDFAQRWMGVMDIHIDKRTNHAQLRVEGDVYVSGILYVNVSKIEPRAGDRFELISNAKSLRGRFGKVMLQTFKDVEGRIVYDNLDKKQDLDGDGKYDVTLVFEAATNGRE